MAPDTTQFLTILFVKKPSISIELLAVVGFFILQNSTITSSAFIFKVSLADALVISICLTVPGDSISSLVITAKELSFVPS